jgi:hypothetical protein
MSDWPTLTDARAFIVTDLTANAWTLADAVPERTEMGADNLKLTYEGFFPGAIRGSSPSISAYTQGIAPPTYAGPGTWRIVTAKPARMSGPFWRLEVEARGVIAAKDPKIRWITGSTSSSGEDVTVPGGVGLKPKVATDQPEVGVEIGYLSTSSSPTLAAPGTAITPPTPRPSNPTNVWAALPADKAVYNYPNGWVLKGTDTDRIVANLWWITERYSYVFDVTPG